MKINNSENINLQKATLRYRSSVTVPTANGSTSPAMVAAVLRNFEALGFAASTALVRAISKLSSESFKTWAKEVTSVLKASKGANFSYEPMYPNFPSQVADASDEELYTNAMSQYLGDIIGIRVIVIYEKEERFPFYEDTDLTLLGLAVDDTVIDIAKNLMSSKVSFSETDAEMLALIYKSLSRDNFSKALPEKFENKENYAHVAKMVRKTSVLTDVIDRAQTSTDLLRLAAAFSGAHPSLTEAFRFSKFSRPERRAILGRLSKLAESNSLSEDFKVNRELWKRFAEKLHPAEFDVSLAVIEAFAEVRSSKNISTIATKYETALVSGDTLTAVKALKKRPGVFARKLNSMLSKADSDESEFIIAEFASVADKVSTTVLLQVISFFKTVKENPNREFSTLFTRGVNGSAFALPRSASHISADIADSVIAAAQNGLSATYAARETLGKVFYDFDGSYNPVVPFGLRNTSDAFRVVGRGTRTKFDTDSTLRFFIHWVNEGDWRVDLDLSAVVLDESFNSLADIAYYNLRGEGVLHSGDRTDAPAPHGASEFIDVNVQKVTKNYKGARYIAMTVHSYTHQKYSELTEVLVGFMNRKDSGSGEVYEPKSVENAFSVNSASTAVVPMVFDLLTGEAIFTDTPFYGGWGVNNARSTSHTMSEVLKGIVSKKSVTYDDVISANLSERASLVEKAEDADLVVTLKNGVSSIGFDEFIGQWL